MLTTSLRVAALLVLLLPPCVGAIESQRLAVSPPTRPEPRIGGMAAAGLAAGAAGMLAGAYIGGTLGGGDRVCGDDPCGFEEAIWGAAAGVSIMIPLGVHLAGGRRGSYATELATSLAIGALGLGVALMSNSAVPLIAVPVAQLVATIAMERRAAARSP